MQSTIISLVSESRWKTADASSILWGGKEESRS